MRLDLLAALFCLFPAGATLGCTQIGGAVQLQFEAADGSLLGWIEPETGRVRIVSEDALRLPRES